MLYRISIVIIVVAINWLKCKFNLENLITIVWSQSQNNTKKLQVNAARKYETHPLG